MADRLRQLLSKVLEWWNKFTPKQKTLIISAGAGVILAFGIIITVLSQPKYVPLLECENTKEASEVTALLDNQSIGYKITDDGLKISVVKNKQAEANMLLGANDIQSVAYSIDNVTSGGFSSTESDKQRRYQLYLENRMANDILGKFTAVKSAEVQLYIPENDGTLIAKNEESHAMIVLELQEEFTTDNAAFLAKALSTALGNSSDKNIVIMDTTGNMLFSGDESYSLSSTASTQLGVKNQAEATIKNEVRKVLMGTNQFDKVEVAGNIAVDFSTSTSTDHEYYVGDGQTQGYLSHEEIYSSESTNGAGGVPGTDSNTDDTTYQYQDNSESNSSSAEEVRDYLPSEKITSKDIPPGVIIYADSSVSVTAVDYNVVREEDAREQGLLDGITWAEYKLANQEKQKIAVDDDIYEVVSKATGISRDNIAIVAYSEYVFFDVEGINVSMSDVVQIVLIVVILGLLAFVVIRSMRTEKQPVQEEELSVETLLQSQPEIELEDISMETESEARKQIDKFVEDNPEAAAALLRNWLNEDWA